MRAQISFSGIFGNRVESYLKRRAETPATALRFNCAMMKIDKMFGNRQTQAEAAKLTGHRGVSLLKWREQRSQPPRLNSNPVVGDFKMETAAFIVKVADGDLPARGTEFDGIIDQVPKYLLKSDTISQDVMLLRVESRRDL